VLTTHPHLAPKLKSRAILLLPLCVSVACSWENFSFTSYLIEFPATIDRRAVRLQIKSGRDEENKIK
jgi:hypothetical protein